MRHVAEWLQALGLPKYADVFNKHEIDFEALPYLTESMLERLGLPIGPRAKVLAAISELARLRDAGQSLKTKQIGPVGLAAQNQQAERRQITVVFCDIVDSSSLAGRLDPEDLGSVIRAYQEACKEIIERHGGNVARYFGDGIMAYFGWPVTREDAAERAVLAGLQIVGAVKGIATPDPLSVRVGICTGIVLIGGVRAGDPAIPADAIGETPYLASRLQSIATPNSVVIAEATSRLLSARFDLEELGPRNLKGISEPVRVLRVRSVQDNLRRFRASRGKPLTSLIGRDEELAFLNRRWRNAKSGEGQIVFISGIPGVGKSRIVHELETSIEGESYCSMHFQCLPHCMESPMFPIIQQIRSLAHLTAEDDVDTTLDKIGKLISPATEEVDETLPLIAEMIGAPIGSRYPPLALTAQQIKTKTLLSLAQLLIGISARGPVFCVLEDTQWIDPSAKELLELVTGQIEKASVLLIVTHRPEWQSPSHIICGNVSKLTLSRLSRDEAAEMTHLVLRHQAVSPLLLERIVNESDAIPLFVEELARGVMVEEGRSNRHAADDSNAESSASWSVPESLRDSLVARLDRVPQARSVAQMASVVGREFTYNLLSRISPLIRLELDSALEHLEQNEIIQRVGSHPFDRYVFKHALLRDAAYESLLRSHRRRIHAKVASAIEEERPEIVAAQPELLAYHYGLAGNAELAAQYWFLGGQRARSRSANFEAAGQFQRALEALESLPETRERKRSTLEIQLSLGLCLIAVRGYSSDETRRSFELAHNLCAELDEQSKGLQAFFGLWGHYWMTARHDRAISLSETLLLKAKSSREPIALIVGHRSLGCTLFTQGEFVRARGHLEQAIVLAEQAAVDVSNLSYAVHPRIAAQLVLAWDLWILGYPGKALHLTLQALALSAERGEPYGVAFAHYVTSAVLLLRGEPKDALLHAEESFAVSREHRINLYQSFSQFGRGCAHGMMGLRENAISDIQQGIEAARRSDLRYMRAFMLGSLATVQADAGDPETAMSTLNEAFEHTNEVAGRAWEAELYRLRGDILLLGASDAMEMAERSYRDAIGVARRQHAHSLELRATTSLARLLHSRHRNDEAFELLTPAYSWFVEGFDTVDLKEAKALLSELRSEGPFA